VKTELCYLAPLWQLFQKLLASVTPRYYNVPSVVRALTELFYTAETLAMVSILAPSVILIYTEVYSASTVTDRESVN